MSEKRFTDVNIDFENSWIKLKDNGDFLIFPIKFDDKEEYGLETLEDLLNGLSDKIDKQQATIEKQNELIKLIANACTYSKEHSVKEILRKEIKGIDTVTYESAGAWHDYVILSEFFKEHYKEHWDNE